MGSPKPKPQPYQPPPAPKPPKKDTQVQEEVAETSRVARQKRRFAGGYRSTILTGGLGVLDEASTRRNTLG